jgi:hypothetical protein
VRGEFTEGGSLSPQKTLVSITPRPKAPGESKKRILLGYQTTHPNAPGPPERIVSFPFLMDY